MLMTHSPWAGVPAHTMEVADSVCGEAGGGHGALGQGEEAEKSTDMIQEWMVKTGGVMCHITLFQSTRDCTWDSGPLKSEWSQTFYGW